MIDIGLGDAEYPPGPSLDRVQVVTARTADSRRPQVPCILSRSLRPRSCYLSDMSAGRPPDRTPEEPPRGKRDAEFYLVVATVTAFLATVLMLAYALSVR